jgi:hypothetical protein
VEKGKGLQLCTKPDGLGRRKMATYTVFGKKIPSLDDGTS